jgi:uncharacterized membrane protein YoaK (UPF0700 family)
MVAPLSAGGAAPPFDPHGPLMPLLFVLTFITGLVDAISYLQLGHVFVANMTGNVIVLGFSIAGVQEFSLAASLTALAAFAFGAALGGRLGLTDARQRRRFLISALATEGICMLLAALPVLFGHSPEELLTRYAMIVLLGIAIGVQTAMVRRLAVPDMTTTVLTLTLAGLAADSHFAGGNNPRLGRRLAAIAIMVAGAALGTYLSRHASAAWVLLIAVGLLTVGGTIACGGAPPQKPGAGTP